MTTAPTNQGLLQRGSAALLLLAFAACATPRVEKPTAARPSVAEIGTMAVAPVGWPPEMVVWTPGGAKAGAKEGAKAGAEFLFSSPLTLFLGLAFYGAGFVIIPATGALIGAAAGTAKGTPGADVLAFHGAASPIVLDVRFAETLQDQILQRLRTATPIWAVFLADDAARGLAGPSGYADIATRGIDTVLEVRLTRVDVAGPSGAGPTGILDLAVRTRIVRASDGHELWAGDFHETVGGSPFTSEAESLARLREEFSLAIRSLAIRIVNAVTDHPGEPASERDALDW